MRRLFVPIIIAFAVGCGERAITPTSALAPGAASRDAGTPPPPPISGDGSMDFDASRATDGSSAGDCTVAQTIPFSFQYLLNNTFNNAFLHIDIGSNPDVTIHQTSNKIDTKGTIVGTGFTFTVANTLSGNIISPHGILPGSVTLQLVGTLTVGSVTCTANATLTANLAPST